MAIASALPKGLTKSTLLYLARDAIWKAADAADAVRTALPEDYDPHPQHCFEIMLALASAAAAFATMPVAEQGPLATQDELDEVIAAAKKEFAHREDDVLRAMVDESTEGQVPS